MPSFFLCKVLMHNTFRNNHGGGFAGVSVVPWAESDSSMKAFDDNVFHVSCNERTCESDYNDSFEGDVNPASKRCSKVREINKIDGTNITTSVLYARNSQSHPF